MSTPTEAQKALSELVHMAHHKRDAAYAAQLIADSEARAVEHATNRMHEEELKPCMTLCDQLRTESKTWEAAATTHLRACEQLRAENTHLRAFQIGDTSIADVVKLRGDMERLAKELSDSIADSTTVKVRFERQRAEKAESELTKLRVLYSGAIEGRDALQQQLATSVSRTEHQEIVAELAKERAWLTAIINYARAELVDCSGHYGEGPPDTTQEVAKIDAMMKEGA